LPFVLNPVRSLSARVTGAKFAIGAKF